MKSALILAAALSFATLAVAAETAPEAQPAAAAKVAPKGRWTNHSAFQLGFRHSYGNAKPASPESLAQELAALRINAGSGDAEAQYRLAEALSSPQDNRSPTESDKAEALKWYRLAAGQNHVPAMERLGILLLLGIGTPKDEKSGVDWLRKAAGYDHARAQIDLGHLFSRSPEAADQREAAGWFRRAADLGNAHAQLEYAKRLRDGSGVPRDAVEAYARASVAARLGETDALKTLETLPSMPAAEAAKAKALETSLWDALPAEAKEGC